MSQTMKLDLGGQRRIVVVHVPIRVKGSMPLPLVLNLHGLGATATEEATFTDMNSTSDRHGFIVAYPQALERLGSGFAWSVPGEPPVSGSPIPTNGANDMVFLSQVVLALEHSYCIDTSRVYATGFSQGARMASQLACDDSTIFAAIAVVSGLRRPIPCPNQRAVPMLAFHGTADPINPYGGSTNPIWTYSVPQAASLWGHQDQCKTTTRSSGVGFQFVRYSDCRNRAEVELYSMVGEGHEWPGGPVQSQATLNMHGPQTNALNANELIWSFFRNYSMPNF